MGLYKKSTAIKTSEAEVLKACKQYLLLRGHKVWRQNTGQLTQDGRHIRFGIPGLADIGGSTNTGRALQVECKSGAGKLSAAQMNFRDWFVESGGLYVLARSVKDLQEAGL